MATSSPQQSTPKRSKWKNEDVLNQPKMTHYLKRKTEASNFPFASQDSKKLVIFESPERNSSTMSAKPENSEVASSSREKNVNSESPENTPTKKSIGKEKKVICESPKKASSASKEKLLEVIELDSETSEDSLLVDTLFSLQELPGKKARVAKRPLNPIPSDCESPKKIAKNSKGTRVALEERKNLNINNKPDIPPSPSKKKSKRLFSDCGSQDGNKNSDFPSKRLKPSEKQPSLELKSTNKKLPENSSAIVACRAVDEKAAESVGNNSQRRIVRRSSAAQKDAISITSKVTVGLEAINSAAAVAFSQTYKDLETLLDLNLSVQTFIDFDIIINKPRRELSNRYYVNFNFHMKKPENYLIALGSLRCINSFLYPHPENFHTIIYKLMLETKERVMLHRASELVYNVLSLHPPGGKGMQQYYWSIMSRRFNDPDPCSRWDYMRELFEEVLSTDEQLNPDLAPTQLECKREVLGYLLQLLDDDLRCWMRLTNQPSASLRNRDNIPLVARLLWPQSTIPHITPSCKEAIRFHITALKSNSYLHLSLTEPLMKMMSIVVQLYDLNLPLKIRKPSEHMSNLAREILKLADTSVTSNSWFFASFGSPELRLLLPLALLSGIKPQIPMLEGERLTLTCLMKSYLELESDRKAVNSFWKLPELTRSAFKSALEAYFREFLAHKIWFHMRDKYRKTGPIGGKNSPQPPLNIFSKSFTLNHLLEDLRQAKRLLQTSSGSSRKEKSLLSTLYWKKD